MASGNFTARLDDAGIFDLSRLPVKLSPRDGFDWTVGVSASLPLFEGGALRAARTRAEHELQELRIRRRAAADRIEQSIRSTLHLAAASSAGIELAADAAGAARRNLELVTGAYEQAVVSILDLLDAQHAALLASEAATTAVYDHLIDLMDAQRAFGGFGFFADAAETTSFGQRLRAFFAEADYAPSDRP